MPKKLNFTFHKRCPNCNAKPLGGSKTCIIYECGGKVSITADYGDCLTFIFKNCNAEPKKFVKERFINNKENKEDRGK